MKKTILLFTLGISALLHAASVDFSGTPEKMKIVTHPKWVQHLMKADDCKDFKFTANFQVSGNKNEYTSWAAFLIRGSKGSITLRTRGKTFEMVAIDNNKERSSINSPPFKTPLKNEISDEWNSLTLTRVKNLFELNMNNQYLGNVKLDIGEIKQVVAYGSNLTLAVQNASLDPYEQKETRRNPVSKEPTFYASFDNDLNAGKVFAEKPANVKLVPGLKGNALSLTTEGKKYPSVTYPVTMEPGEGTISFWWQAGWEGVTDDLKRPFYAVFSGLDGSGKEVMSMSWQERLRLTIPREGEMAPYVLTQDRRRIVQPGGWYHFTLVYNNKDWSTLYVNGASYVSHESVTCKPFQITNFDLGKVKKISFGDPKRTSNGLIDEFKIYNRALSEKEIMEEYRKYFPYDFVMDKAGFLTEENIVMELSVAPAEYYSHVPIQDYDPKRPLAPRKLTMKLIEQESGKLLKEQSFLPKAQTEPQILQMKVGHLPQKFYQLLVEIENPDGIPARRIYPVNVWQPQPVRTPAAKDRTLQKKKLLFERILTQKTDDILADAPVKEKKTSAGAYLEAGSRNTERFSFVIPFAKEIYEKGRPVLLEIEWPDDALRSMGLYMYAQVRWSHRDRLFGGVQAGEEYPSSGKMQKTEYLFYPDMETYLFEARTMVTGSPAAIAAVRVYGLEDELPRLNITKPVGYKMRQFGHCDEDQTVDYTFGIDGENAKGNRFKNARIFEKLTEYMNYTGSNAWSISIYRYVGPWYEMNGALYHYQIPRGFNEIPLFIEMFRRSGIDFYGAMHSSVFDELKARKYSDGWTSQDAESTPGDPSKRIFPLRHMKLVTERFSRYPGFKGIDFRGYVRVKSSFDSYSIQDFCKRTGIKLPESPELQKQELLGKYKKEWINYLSTTVTDLYRDLTVLAKQINPEIDLSVYRDSENENLQGQSLYRCSLESADDIDEVKWLRETEFFDLNAIKEIPGLEVGPRRSPSRNTWDKHWGRPEGITNEQLYDLKRAALFKKGVSVNIFPSYFETFAKPLNPKVYANYFQDADVKPHGRYFLKELVYSVAMHDARRILIGAQPIGTWGRDAETREFAQAYTALPAEVFEDAKGNPDPITVRYFQSKNGTYFYAASLLWDDGSVSLSLPGVKNILDLSTGERLKVPSNGILTLPLKAYQLRSFLAEQTKTAPEIKSVTVSERQKQAVAERIEKLKNLIDKMKQDGIDSGRAPAKLAEALKALKEGRYSEVHRILFSKIVNKIIGMESFLKTGALKKQKDMIANSHYAINCGFGGTEFYLGEKGKIFFPDHPWDGTYGYLGKTAQVVRDVSPLKGTKDVTLFETESYNIDGYRFKVKDGTYTIRMYFRIAWTGNAKPDKSVFSAFVNGKALINNFDLFKVAGDKPLVKEFRKVSVKGGMLDLTFSVPQGKSLTVRLLNALEIIPETKD